MLFDDERGLPLPLGASSDAPRKGGRRKASEAVDKNHSEAESVAVTYAEVAISLQADSSRMATVAGAPPPAPAPGGPLAAPSWRSVGPTSMPNGQTYGASRVVVSGRVAAIAVDPSDRNHILVGSAGGGVWESRNRGVSWTPRTDGMPTLTTGAIAFTPSNPRIVYVGTGEGNFYWRLGAGVLRSTDGGATWSVLATNPFMGSGFYDLLVDPANANHLLSATTGGLHESTDGGLHWTQRRAGLCWDLSMHPSGGATAEVFAGCQDGLFRSTNSGQTWTAVALPGAPASFNRMAVAHSRSNPNVVYVFAAGGATAFLWRRTAAGGAFTAIAPPAGLSTGQAWYDWFLAVAPDTENRIYLGAIDAYRGELSGATWSWADISSKPTGDSIHPDQHAIAFDPTDANMLYVGCDGGLFRSANRGVNWEPLNNGLVITELEYLAQDYGSSRFLLAGTQDNGSIRYTGSSVWEHVNDGDGGDCSVNRANPNTVFCTRFNMGVFRSTTKGGWGSFGWIGPSVPAGFQNLFYPPMESCNDTIAQAGSSAYISRDNGTNWTSVALPVGCVASAMYMPTVGRVLVGCTNGQIFRIDWSGAAWSAATALTTPRANAWVSDLFVNPGSLNRIWATSTSTGGGRVFRSDDGGVNWIDRTAGLPALPINAVEVDPANANRIWVAADLGVFQSLDAGATWGAFSLGLPNVLIGDLLFHPHARVLRAGTRNRGAWEIPVDGWLTQPICGVQFNGTLPGNGQTRYFTFGWPATWHMIWTIMPTSIRPGAPQVSWQVQVERASAEFATYWITVKNLTPDQVTFEGRYAILSKY